MCDCSTKHVPDPHVFFTVAGYRLCPTAYENLKLLRKHYKEHQGRPPGSITKHFGKHIRQIAQELEEK